MKINPININTNNKQLSTGRKKTYTVEFDDNEKVDIISYGILLGFLEIFPGVKYFENSKLKTIMLMCLGTISGILTTTGISVARKMISKKIDERKKVDVYK